MSEWAKCGGALNYHIPYPTPHSSLVLYAWTENVSTNDGRARHFSVMDFFRSMPAFAMLYTKSTFSQ